MLRIALQQRELLVSAISYLKGKRMVGPPKTLRGAVFHYLQRTDPSVLLIVQRVLHGPVQPARRQVGLDPPVERPFPRIRIEPQPQFFQLLLRQRPNRALNLLDLLSAHIPR